MLQGSEPNADAAAIRKSGLGGKVRSLLRDLRIGSKLSVGFGLLVALTLLVAGLNYLGSREAVRSINQTTNLSAPSAVASSKAQADLLRMMSAVRGYLALGEESYQKDYQAASVSFAENLNTLSQLLEVKEAGQLTLAGPDVAAEMEEFREKLAKLQALPPELFALRDDQLRREPALKILITDANPLIAKQVAIIKSMMTGQQTREPTPGNIKLLSTMAEFQSSLYAMVAGLRGYVTTKRDNFKFEFNANLSINTEAWNSLNRLKEGLTTSQQALLQKMTVLRDTFLKLPQLMFTAAESEHAREDLYLFRTEFVPLAERMLTILDGVAQQEQDLLRADLTKGRDQLAAGQRAVLAGGLIAVLAGILLSLVFRKGIAGPIGRLTGVADRIRSGDLTARAPVESADEIGELANTFNKMTGQLRTTLEDLEERRRLQESLAQRFKRQSEYLSALHDTSIGLVAQLDLTELLSDLTTRAGSLLGSPHGYVYLVDPSGKQLERMVGIGVYAASIGQKLGPDEGVAGAVWSSGRAFLVNDYQNWEGKAAFASGLDVTIKSVLGVPLKTGNVTIGVLGLAYDESSTAIFGEGEIELLTRFAQLASIALENARLHETTTKARLDAEEAGLRVAEQNRMLESLSSKLSKYLSPQVFASIFAGKQNVEISSKRKKLTVFFSDIADFTSTTDNLESEELTELLNRYLTEMAQIALQHGATIDKYIGDAILAFFGDPETRGVKEDALACVRMAVAMQRRMRELQSEWIAIGRERPFQLRIGINTGFCTVGNFGSEDRMDYTIIGGEVNLASRLQSHAELGGILLAHETYSLVKDEFEAEEQPPLVVKGFAQPVRTYRLKNIHADRKASGIFRHLQDGLRIEFDARNLGKDDKDAALAALQTLIDNLRS